MNNQCASQPQIDVLSSSLYFTLIQTNLLVVFVSFVVAAIAIRELYSQSIINSSTRLFLVINICYAMVHQLSYLYIKVDVTYKILFKLDEPCDLLFSVYDCRFVSRGFMIGSSGLTLVQTAMTFDRIFASCCSRLYRSHKKKVGYFLTVVMIISSCLTWDVLTLGDPLDTYIQNCGLYPQKSQENFDNFLVFCFFVAVVNFVINIINLKFQTRKSRKYRCRKQFNMVKRYNSLEHLKNSQAITILSTTQILGMSLWNGVVYLIRSYKSSFSLYQYILLLTGFYVPPYVCTFIPLMIIVILRRIRNNRVKVIRNLRNQKETQDEYMDKLKKVWS